MNDVGRPTKKTEKLVQKLVKALEMDFTVEEACVYAGIGKTTFYNWYGEDEEFRDEIDRAKRWLVLAAKKNVARDIYGYEQRDDNGNVIKIPGDGATSRWLLKHRAPEYTTRQINENHQSPETLNLLRDIANGLNSTPEGNNQEISEEPVQG